MQGREEGVVLTCADRLKKKKTGHWVSVVAART